ncbi:helix-turn-helix domain-containing protein [Aliamphritea hakodatensis]|uniref:helix-turn-helix domain-containing protein n=1 Tax=Aliamphritea hakodatensis TaxID=2895352 RepID=UPI0022FD7995|nr:AraC family transcriptional regulator [Aliamphritea hakodatensis]
MPNAPKSFFQAELERIYREEVLPPEKYEQVRQSRELMDTHYSARLELDDLAKAACMSRFHFVRIFQQMYGLTPRVYLRDLRISKAKDLIKTGMPVTQACLDVGYQSMPTFSSVFKKCTGNTPREYQRMHNSNRE